MTIEVHPSAVIDGGAKIGKGAYICPHTDDIYQLNNTTLKKGIK
tara:strand:- start:414 stop:545 length:132 start_codon:yes stop_codon:yes gene_type:complete